MSGVSERPVRWSANPVLLRILLIVSLLVNVALVVFIQVRRMYYQRMNLARQQEAAKATPVVRNDSLVTFSYNKIKADAVTLRFFELLPHDRSDIVFLGNSLTAGFPLQEMFQSARIKNRGIGGNTSADVLKRLEEVTKGHPKKIFLEIGVNDLAKKITSDSLLTNIRLIAEKIRTETPATILYIQSVFPTALEQKPLVPAIEDYNKKLKAYCEKTGVKCIDLYNMFYKDGGLNEALTTDGVHFRPEAYFIWKKNIAAYVK